MFFVFFGFNLRNFRRENCNKVFEKAYWTTHLFLVVPFQRSNQQILSKNKKKSRKSFKFETFWDFCHFRFQFGHFHKENCNKLFKKVYWSTTQSFLVDPFERSNPQSPSKIRKKTHRNFLFFRFDFVIFGVNLRHFHSKNSNYLFEEAYWTKN